MKIFSLFAFFTVFSLLISLEVVLLYVVLGFANLLFCSLFAFLCVMDNRKDEIKMFFHFQMKEDALN